jgi:hypothetical protein
MLQNILFGKLTWFDIHEKGGMWIQVKKTFWNIKSHCVKINANSNRSFFRVSYFVGQLEMELRNRFGFKKFSQTNRISSRLPNDLVKHFNLWRILNSEFPSTDYVRLRETPWRNFLIWGIWREYIEHFKRNLLYYEKICGGRQGST